ncbi:MAG: hypothetical protein ABJG47_01595 [Ekhidna sp.]
MQELSSFLRDSSRNYELVVTKDLGEIRNIYVDSLYLRPNEDNLSELSILVDFGVHNMTNGSVVVKLMQGTRQLSSVVKDVTELDDVRFDILKDNYGSYEIAIDGDDVVYDNAFHFTIGERAKSQIVILNSTSSNLLKDVYGNSDLFDLAQQDLGNLNYDVMMNADLVVISDEFELPEDMKNQLMDKNYIVFPPDSINVVSYERFFDFKLTGLTEKFSEIDVDTKHPLFKGVFKDHLEYASQSAKAALFNIEGIFEPVISYRGGVPFLLEKGGAYFFNSSISSGGSGFESNALFLPILYQIAFSSIGMIENPYYYPGDRLTLKTDATDVPIKISKSGYEVIPSFNSSGTEVVLEIPFNLEVGTYVVTQGADTLRSIALNIPKEESAMIAPSLEEFTKEFSRLPNVNVSQILAEESSVTFAAESQSSFWKYALILAVFLLLIETLLHRYLK